MTLPGIPGKLLHKLAASRVRISGVQQAGADDSFTIGRGWRHATRGYHDKTYQD